MRYQQLRKRRIKKRKKKNNPARLKKLYDEGDHTDDAGVKLQKAVEQVAIVLAKDGLKRNVCGKEKHIGWHV